MYTIEENLYFDLDNDVAYTTEPNQFDHMYDEYIERYTQLDAQIKQIEIYSPSIDKKTLKKLQVEKEILREFLMANADA